MGTRLDLQTLLEGLHSGVSVYFQPPADFEMVYPAIVYNRNYEYVSFADNIPYDRTLRYQITVIDKDPDSPIPDLVAGLPLTTYVRHYTTESLNHDIYYTYF
jgi:hypothetical protein